MSTTCGLLAFDGMDLMDFAGPYEVLLTANRLAERQSSPAPFVVATIGEPVVAFGGLGVDPTHRVRDIEALDVLIVPGAIDVAGAKPDDDLLFLAARTQVLASVCTGAFFLERNGLLGQGPVTTHWEDADALVVQPAVTDRRWVDKGSVVTAGGISSGIAMTLHLVERFATRELAEATARQIDYVWTEHR